MTSIVVGGRSRFDPCVSTHIGFIHDDRVAVGGEFASLARRPVLFDPVPFEPDPFDRPSPARLSLRHYSLALIAADHYRGRSARWPVARRPDRSPGPRGLLEFDGPLAGSRRPTVGCCRPPVAGPRPPGPELAGVRPAGPHAGRSRAGCALTGGFRHVGQNAEHAGAFGHVLAGCGGRRAPVEHVLPGRRGGLAAPPAAGAPRPCRLAACPTRTAARRSPARCPPARTCTPISATKRVGRRHRVERGRRTRCPRTRWRPRARR